MKRFAILDSDSNVVNVIVAQSEEDCDLPEGCTVTELTSSTQTMGDGSEQTTYQAHQIGQPLS